MTPLELVRRIVWKIVRDDTGEDYAEILQAGHVMVDPRDYVEILTRIESYFDCTLALYDARPALGSEMALDVEALARRVFDQIGAL
jgi:hypothetical protein